MHRHEQEAAVSATVPLLPTLTTRSRAARSRRTVTIAAVSIALAAALPVRAEDSWWGWGRADQHPAAWDPARFADYLFTGHEPHPAVARIVAPEQSGTALGSGVLVDVNRSQGLVLTNWHVVRDSRSSLLVQFADGFQSAGTVVRWDEAWDLAAVVIWKPPAVPITIASQPPMIGERLTIAGFGRGVYREETGPCTDYLSPGNGLAKEFVELQATARQGDSGGPIFNGKRELAGVLFGQAEGRTIGSCSTRVRMFLTSVGSSGFTPLPIAEFSDEPAIARGLGTPAGVQPARLASADGSIERSTYVASPLLAAGPSLHQPAQQSTPQPTAMPDPMAFVQGPGPAGDSTAAREAPADIHPSRPPVSIPMAVLRIVTDEGSHLLAGAGGVALALFGLRIVFGGRRFTAPADE